MEGGERGAARISPLAVAKASVEPLVENDPAYGRVYHIGGVDDLVQMAAREDVMISMPHPRTEGCTSCRSAKCAIRRAATTS